MVHQNTAFDCVPSPHHLTCHEPILVDRSI